MKLDYLKLKMESDRINADLNLALFGVYAYFAAIMNIYKVKGSKTAKTA